MITETITLPDPSLQPLVHPLDLPEARAHFRFAFWIRALTNPGTGLVLAALVWFLAESWVVPVVVFLSLAVIGHFAAAWSDRRAWEYIPRKRQDTERRLPLSWELGRSVIFAALLSVGVMLLALRLGGRETGVRDYTLGSAVAVVAMMIVVLAVRHSRAALFSIPSIVALAASLAFAWSWMSRTPVDPSIVLMGALVMLAVGAVVGVGKLIEERRTAATA
ncbi:hypothetical protein EYE40_01205 [Glaciihabitans arcticus]|uniref:Uncharacterized protein n=1 Tax=Glaciihabitans arcticus TaxID=2668039 RepID=A0A4Q9GMV8_9MICO|nr:hypothetical protein [Glaciihabitans arcticus]TBN56122.1 hypothetical protein EYE40_01205 [Glaciihabitans arcticus]